MTSVRERIKRREKYPIDIGDGVTVYVRAMKHSEAMEVVANVDTPEATGFAIGCCLVEDDGTPVMTRIVGESFADFGSRVMSDLDLSTDIAGLIVNGIGRISQGVTPKQFEALQKN